MNTPPQVPVSPLNSTPTPTLDRGLTPPSPPTPPVASLPQNPTVPTIWDTAINGSNPFTSDATPKKVANCYVPIDGIIAILINVVAANQDQSDWAAFLIAEVIATCTNGVITIHAGAANTPSASNGATSATWAVNAVVNGRNIEIYVVGANNVTVKWSAHMAANYNEAP